MIGTRTGAEIATEIGIETRTDARRDHAVAAAAPTGTAAARAAAAAAWQTCSVQRRRGLAASTD